LIRGWKRVLWCEAIVERESDNVGVCNEFVEGVVVDRVGGGRDAEGAAV